MQTGKPTSKCQPLVMIIGARDRERTGTAKSREILSLSPRFQRPATHNRQQQLKREYNNDFEMLSKRAADLGLLRFMVMFSAERPVVGSKCHKNAIKIPANPLYIPQPADVLPVVPQTGGQKYLLYSA
ncbi:MAG: hypothetical protein NDI73_11465 [Desulfuromonadales bacterium]|nr:hypothetical protein [Desulfuromonadales bacterium]